MLANGERALKMNGARYLCLYFATFFALQLGWWLGRPNGLLIVGLGIAMPPLLGGLHFKGGRIGSESNPRARYFRGIGVEAVGMGVFFWAFGAIFVASMDVFNGWGTPQLLMGLFFALTLFMGFWIPSFRSITEVFVDDMNVTVFKGGRPQTKVSWSETARIWLTPGGKNSPRSITFASTDGRTESIDDMEDLPWKTFESLVRTIRIETGRRPHIIVEDKLTNVGNIEPAVVEKAD